MPNSANANGKDNDSTVNVQSIVLSKLIDDPQMKEMIVMEVRFLYRSHFVEFKRKNGKFSMKSSHLDNYFDD